MADLVNFKHRLLRYLKIKGISTRSFEKKCEVANGYFNKLINFPSEDKFRAILYNCPDINPVWLITGEGDMLKPDTGESEPVKADLVPELPINAAAGFTDDIQSGITPSMCSMLPRIPGLPPYDLTISVRGDSMSPSFESGDRLAIRRCFDIVEWGAPHVIDTDEGVYIKRITEADQSIVCASDNPDYPQFLIPKSSVRGIYRVVAALRIL